MNGKQIVSAIAIVGFLLGGVVLIVFADEVERGGWMFTVAAGIAGFDSIGQIFERKAKVTDEQYFAESEEDDDA